MADPDIRETTNLQLKYPAKDLNPWDDKYIEQMDRLDETILYALQSSRLFFAQRLFDWDYTTGELTFNQCTIVCPVFGGIFDGNSFFLTVPDNNGVYLNVPAGKWATPVALTAGSFTIQPLSANFDDNLVLLGFESNDNFICCIPDAQVFLK
jgi:hypothetical protein